MGTLWCYAIAIDQVRDVFGASETEAAELRAIAADRFGDPTARRTGTLGKLGPVFRRPPNAPVVRPDSPGREDCDRLLAGQHIPPPRLAASWRLLQTWIEARAWSSHSCAVDAAVLSTIEFDLARAGVPAHHSVNCLLRRDLGIAMLPAPGTAVGYSTGHHAVDTARAWHDALDELPTTTAEWVGGRLTWLDGYPGWQAAAAEAGRPAPDLVALLAA